MKRLFALVISMVFCSASIADEKPIVLNFDRVPVLELVNAVYGDILKKSFAIDPSLASRTDVVSVHFQHADSNQVVAYVETLFDSLGFQVDQKPGFVFIKPKDGDSERELFYYRPKHRTATYLTDLIMTMFDRGRFSTQRGIKIGAGSNPATSSSVPVSDTSAATRSSSSSTGSYGGASSNVDVGNSSGMSSPDIDSFIFEGSAKEIARLQKLLAQIDTPPGEIQVTAIVYEVGNSSQEGGALSLAVDILNGKLGIKTGSPSLSNFISIKAGGFEAVVSALNSDSRFRVVSYPSLRVRSGSHGVVSVGQDYPVPSVSLDRNGNPIQTVEFKPSGVILDLKPTIMEDRIDLVIDQQISSFVPVATGNTSVPSLQKRQFSTTVGMVPGEIIALGGLNEFKASQDANGLSFLPKWTYSYGQDSSNTQILLFLQVNKI
ncbi:MAG: hypothetical protein WC091_01465 [Sulfuricellaceae bacterium]